MYLADLYFFLKKEGCPSRNLHLRLEIMDRHWKDPLRSADTMGLLECVNILHEFREKDFQISSGFTEFMLGPWHFEAYFDLRIFTFPIKAESRWNYYQKVLISGNFLLHQIVLKVNMCNFVVDGMCLGQMALMSKIFITCE